RPVVARLLACSLIPSQPSIVPACHNPKGLGLLSPHLCRALPLCSTIVCIFVFKAAFDAVPRSLIDAARLDGLGDLGILARIMLPLSTAAVATNVVLAFIWSWNNFLWPLIVVRNQEMQTLPLALSTFLSYLENTTAALYAFCIMALIPGLLVFVLAQKQFVEGLTAGATKG